MTMTSKPTIDRTLLTTMVTCRTVTTNSRDMNKSYDAEGNTLRVVSII